MSLKTAVDSVCDAVNIDRLDAVYGGPDPSAAVFLALAQEAGDEIARRVDWQALLSSKVLAASGEQLPPDFQRVVPGGGLRTAAGLFIRPVTNSAQWAVVASCASAQPFYFVSGGVVQVAPVTAAIGAVLDYVAKTWIVGDGGTRKAAFSADDDGFVFPERLVVKNIIWRWRRQKGLSYDDQLAEFEADLAQETGADRGVS